MAISFLLFPPLAALGDDAANFAVDASHASKSRPLPLAGLVEKPPLLLLGFTLYPPFSFEEGGGGISFRSFC